VDLRARVTPRTGLRNGAVCVAGVGVAMASRRRARRQVGTLHDVADGAKFRRCVEWLLGRYTIVSLADLLSANGESGRARLALTFDDGYADWYDVAAPVLTDLRCPATFFVCSGFVGLEGRSASRFKREQLRRSRDLAPLSRSQLAELAGGPLFDIGSHTASHIDFAQNMSSETLVTEIDGDRKLLEDLTQQRVNWFAYPFGGERQLSPLVVDHVRGAGFEAAFTALPGSLDTASDRFLLPRQSIDLLGGRLLWQARLNGGYELVFRARQRAFRALGRTSAR
jgi:peptidoglycan/xylan/chitin deacetylase (PgdA/CDA1 family)